MTFRAAHWLWLFVVVALFAAAYVVQALRRRRYVVRFTQIDLLDAIAPVRPRWRRHVPAVLFLLSMVALVLSLGEPFVVRERRSETATILLAVDVSPSMRATDVAPDRFTAARAAAREFVTLLPAEIDVGLVSFAGTAEVVVAPTSDRGLVDVALERLEYRSETAIGEAIFASLDALAAQARPTPAQILLLSDGASTQGRPDAAAADAARRSGVTVSTIAFGTRNGVVELSGEVVPVVPDSDALRAIARRTGGSFFEAATTEQLRSAYDALRTASVAAAALHDVSSWFVGTALALAMLAAIASLVWFERLP